MLLALLLATRLWSSGWELNSTADTVEWVGATCCVTGGSISVSTTTVRSGTYAGRANPAAGQQSQWNIQFKSANNAGPFFFRVYIRVATCPSAITPIMDFASSAPADLMEIRMNTSCQLQVYDSGLTARGSLSSALSVGTWYRLEVQYTGGTSTGNSARLDGTDFCTNCLAAAPGSIFMMLVGMNVDGSTSANGDIFFDDVAINDNVGAAQNTYPGDGKVVHLYPNGAGDADTSTGVSNTGSCLTGVDPWNCVKEKPTPNDTTDYATQATTSSLMDVDIEASSTPGIGASDTINVVQVGGRVRGNTATATNWQGRIKSQASGTVATGTLVGLASSTFNTHDDTKPRIYTLTSTADPQAGGAWTPSLLDSAQIGAQTTDGNPAMHVTSLWLLVDYTPAPPAGACTPTMTLLGVGPCG